MQRIFGPTGVAEYSSRKRATLADAPGGAKMDWIRSLGVRGTIALGYRIKGSLRSCKHSRTDLWMGADLIFAHTLRVAPLWLQLPGQSRSRKSSWLPRGSIVQRTLSRRCGRHGRNI